MDEVNTELSAKPDIHTYPRVFVHGLMGWGEADAINEHVPYWGRTSGDILRYLRGRGCECHAASVGQMSSAWDRACELYAQLTGTVTDYGIAHSEKHGHLRFGRRYDRPLVEAWDENRKLDFIAHGFGGVTVRLLIKLLEKGDSDEIIAARERGIDPSPLFTGGKTGWVNSLTTLASPHNGTTCIAANGGSSRAVQLALTASAGAVGSGRFKSGLDCKLEHFGIESVEVERFSDMLSRIMETDFFTGDDNAWTDLDIPGATKLNSMLYASTDVYYFSYAGDMTRSFGDIQLHSARMAPALKHISRAMGAYGDVSWRKNDGLVNTASALYPENEAHVCVSCEPGESAKPGVWYSMPPRRVDHTGFLGGLVNTGSISMREFYTRIMDNIDKTYMEGQR